MWGNVESLVISQAQNRFVGYAALRTESRTGHVAPSESFHLIVPTLQRENESYRSSGMGRRASMSAFPRRSVGTMKNGVSNPVPRY